MAGHVAQRGSRGRFVLLRLAADASVEGAEGLRCSDYGPRLRCSDNGPRRVPGRRVVEDAERVEGHSCCGNTSRIRAVRVHRTPAERRQIGLVPKLLANLLKIADSWVCEKRLLFLYTLRTTVADIFLQPWCTHSV